MSVKSRGATAESAPRSGMTRSWSLFLCLCCFFAGVFFTNRMWTVPSLEGAERDLDKHEMVVSKDYDSYPKKVDVQAHDGLEETSKMTDLIKPLDQTILDLERKLAGVRAQKEAMATRSPLSESFNSTSKHRYFMVVGINTSFRSRKRRDSIRATWLPQGETRKKLENEKGIVLRFVIGHSASPGGILDKAIEAEDRMHGDFLRLEHVEGYHELSGKTKTYFATAVSLWDAEFYIKVDDDVHVNLATLGMILSSHRRKPHVYIGCMKSGPVLAQKGVRYYEPEYWKFGTLGNKYFRHATGQLYAISKELATYISVNQNLLHKYANEDVSLGSWFIGLDVEQLHDRRFCCGTPPGLRGALSVLLPSTGDVAGYAIPTLEFWKFTRGVKRVRTPFGPQAFESWVVELERLIRKNQNAHQHDDIERCSPKLFWVYRKIQARVVVKDERVL